MVEKVHIHIETQTSPPPAFTSPCLTTTHHCGITGNHWPSHLHDQGKVKEGEQTERGLTIWEKLWGQHLKNKERTKIHLWCHENLTKNHLCLSIVCAPLEKDSDHCWSSQPDKQLLWKTLWSKKSSTLHLQHSTLSMSSSWTRDSEKFCILGSEIHCDYTSLVYRWQHKSLWTLQRCWELCFLLQHSNSQVNSSMSRQEHRINSDYKLWGQICNFENLR